MIQFVIKIPTFSDLWLACNKKASEATRINRERVHKVEEQIIWHIRREPISEVNKEYLINAVYTEFNKLVLKSCIWPVKIKDK